MSKASLYDTLGWECVCFILQHQ